MVDERATAPGIFAGGDAAFGPREAAIFGAVAGAVAGLVLLLGRLVRRRR